MTRFKYGLKPVQEQPTIRLAAYFTPQLPDVGSLKFPLGHPDKIQPKMFLNDQIGDCAIAGSIEEVRLANALRGVTVNFSDVEALRNYRAITGFNPDDPDSDQGTDVHELYQYRKATGIVDGDGKYHKILAYAGLTPGNWDELLVALSLFDMVGIGIQVPDYAQDQFQNGEPWHLLDGTPNIEGQHYIPVVGAQSVDEATVFTWGAPQGITKDFYQELNTVAVVALTEELFTNDKSPEGLDMEGLAKDLEGLNTGRVMSRGPHSDAA